MCCTRLAGNAGRKNDAKNRHHLCTIENFVGLSLRNEGVYRQSEKNLLNSNISPTRFHNMANFGPLAAEIRWRVWGTLANFNGFRFFAALLHVTLLVGATYVRQGGHHVGHWPTFSLSIF